MYSRALTTVLDRAIRQPPVPPWDSSRGYHYTEGRRNENHGDSGPEDKELDSELKNSPLRYVHFILAAPLIFRAFLSSV